MALTDNILAYYKLDGNSSDATGNGHTGTDTNATYSAGNGKIIQGVGFSGTGQIKTGTMGSLGSSAALGTIAFWFKSTSTATAAFMGAFNNGSNFGYEVMFNQGPSGNGTGRLRFFLRANGGSRLDGGLNTDQGITDGNWHLLIVDWGTATNSITFTLDNTTLTTTYSLQESPASFSNFDKDFAIGGENGPSGTMGLRYTGAIDEVGFWTRRLSSGEKTELWNAGAGRQYPFATLPTVTTDPATDITATSATGNGEVTDDGGATITRRGFVFGTTSEADPGNVSPEDQTEYEYFVAESGTFGEEAFDLTLEKNYG